MQHQERSIAQDSDASKDNSDRARRGFDVSAGSGALKRHKNGRRNGPATCGTVNVKTHFIETEPGREWECRHCSAAVRSHCCAAGPKMHMAACPRLPDQDRRILDESEVARAATGAGMYGKNPVYRDFEVIGWRKARCKSCLKTVRGGSSALKLHKDAQDRPCTGFPSKASVRGHFIEIRSDDKWTCRHCAAMVCGHCNLKQHLAACARLPAPDRRALDESEVARAAAGEGVYGQNPVYRAFEVTGWLVARCKSCLKTVRGPGDSLQCHHDRTCPGFPATWIEVDVKGHFTKNTSDGQWDCRHCSAVLRGDAYSLKCHMASCSQLPEHTRRALDESEVAKAAAGVGMYGSNPVFHGFQVTGWRVARCTSCSTTVRGSPRQLKRHQTQRCDARPNAASDISSSRDGKPASTAAREATDRTSTCTKSINQVEVSAAGGIGTHTSQRKLTIPTTSVQRQCRAGGVDGRISSGDPDSHVSAADGAATKRWAAAVRAGGGPEAVAAALRARYSRLYASAE